jgi:hypothetical protein
MGDVACFKREIKRAFWQFLAKCVFNKEINFSSRTKDLNTYYF